ncbi:MAG: hypothetical protein P8X82_11350, partial [Gemmatimonadales bacterium]
MASFDRRSMSVNSYVGVVALFGATAFVLSAVLDPLARANEGASVPGVVAFVFIALALQLAEHKLAVGTATGTIAFIVYMASALLFGPTWCAVITAVTVTAAQALNRRAPIKIVFNVSQHVLALVVGTAVYMKLGGPIPPTAIEPAIIPFFGFVLASFAINGTAVSGVIAISEGRRFSEIWIRNTWALAAYDVVASALGLLVAWLYV